MMKPPTNSAMRPNASSAFEMTPKPSLNPWDSFAAFSWPVRASSEAGTTLWTASFSSSGVVPSSAATVTCVELCLLAGQPLGLGQRQDREAGAEELDTGAPAGDPGDRVCLRRSRPRDPHRVADRPAFSFGGEVVDRHLVGVLGWATLRVVPGAEAIGNDRDREMGRSGRADPLPLLVEHGDGRVEDDPGGFRDAVDRLHPLEHRGVEGRRERPAGVLDRLLRLDADVDAAVRFREDAVEGTVDRVGQHQRAGDHGDAEEHREAGQESTHLARDDAA